MTEHDAIDQEMLHLCTQYVEGSISAEDFARLDALLGSDAKARAFYTEFVSVSSLLEHRDDSPQFIEACASSHIEIDSPLMGMTSLGGDSNLLQLASELLAAPDGPLPLTDLTEELKDRKLQSHLRRAEHARQKRGAETKQQPEGALVFVNPKMVAWLSAAAMIGLVIWLSIPNRETAPIEFVTDNSFTDEQERHEGTQLPAVVESVIDTGVVITQQLNIRWAKAEREAGDDLGQTLAADRYELLEGTIELEYPSGTVVSIASPAVFELSPRNGITVTSGRIACESSTTQMAAFQIDSTMGSFSGNGSRWSIDVNDFEINTYVFGGDVRFDSQEAQIQLQPRDRMVAHADQPAVITSNVATPIDIPSDFESSKEFVERRAISIERFNQYDSLAHFAVGQGYIGSGGSAGTATITEGMLQLAPGRNNTLSCFVGAAGQPIPDGYWWSLDLAGIPINEQSTSHSFFFSISTGASPPGRSEAASPMRDGELGFRLRWEQDDNALRIEKDGASPPDTGPFDLHCQGVIESLAIKREGRNSFSFWVKYVGSDHWQLVGTRSHEGLPDDTSIYVGIEAFALTPGGQFAIDNLRLERAPETTNNGQRRP